MHRIDEDKIAATNPAVDPKQLKALQSALAELRALGLSSERRYGLRRPFEGADRTSTPINLRTYAIRSR